MAAPITAADVIRALTSATDAEHVAIRAALKARITPEQAAASAAYVGKGFACTVGDPAICNRTGFRTAGRAAKHGTDAGGHSPAVV